MDTKEIKKIMIIARPAIVAVYGRQKLDLSAYNKMSEDCIWVEVEGYKDYEFVRYKVRIEGGKVTYVNKGEIS